MRKMRRGHRGVAAGSLFVSGVVLVGCSPPQPPSRSSPSLAPVAEEPVLHDEMLFDLRRDGVFARPFAGGIDGYRIHAVDVSGARVLRTLTPGLGTDRMLNLVPMLVSRADDLLVLVQLHGIQLVRGDRTEELGPRIAAQLPADHRVRATLAIDLGEDGTVTAVIGNWSGSTGSDWLCTLTPAGGDTCEPVSLGTYQQVTALVVLAGATAIQIDGARCLMWRRAGEIDWDEGPCGCSGPVRAMNDGTLICDSGTRAQLFDAEGQLVRSLEGSGLDGHDPVGLWRVQVLSPLGPPWSQVVVWRVGLAATETAHVNVFVTDGGPRVAWLPLADAGLRLEVGEEVYIVPPP